MCTITDSQAAPADELAALYSERWEIEGTLDELKTHQRGPRVVLRSEDPDIGEAGRLTAQEEVDLARRIERGDVDARQKLVQSNLRLVVSTAKDYRNQGLSFLELVQEGTLGLVRAAETFDYRNGWKLSAYATGCIRHALVAALAGVGVPAPRRSKVGLWPHFPAARARG